MREPLLRPKDVPAPAWFGRYNFQREEDLVRLVSALTEGPSVLLLSGEAGIGRRYLLQAAVHRLRQSGERVEEILEIDLEGYEEEVGLAKFLELQIEKRRAERDEPREKLLDAFLSAARLGVKGAGWAALLSATLSLKEPLAALGRLLGHHEKGFSGEIFPAREALAWFVQGFSTRVILHVTDPSFLHAVPSEKSPRVWLPQVAERFPHVTLAISCKPGDRDADLAPGAQHEIERLELRRLGREELRALLDLRLAPNEFPSGFADTLLRYSRGLPGLLGGIVWKLYDEAALDEHEGLVWKADDERVAEILSEGLLDPVSQAFHERSGQTRALWMFLLDSALCGGLVPPGMLLSLQSLDEGTQEPPDWMTEMLVNRLGIFEDLQCRHPGFRGFGRFYRFREPILRLAILEHFALAQRRARAAQIAPALRQRLPVRTRDEARLFLTLAQYLGEPERDDYLRELAWWVGKEEADDLREALVSALAERELKPETLWGAVNDTKGRWPAFRRLALLDAYGAGPVDEEGNPLGVPLERLGDFHSIRAELLQELGQYHEAMGHAEHAAGIREAENGKRSLPYTFALSAVGGLALRLGDLTRAQRELEEAESLGRRLLGPEHIDVLKLKYNLTQVLRDQGDLLRARKLLEEVWEGECLLLGVEHPTTLATKDSLAYVLQLQGDLPRARELFEEVVKAEGRLFGPEDTNTLVTKHRLAWVIREQGDLLRAQEIYEEVQEAESRLLGPEHPYTLAAKDNLASILRDGGDLSQALKIFKEVLEVQSRLLGPEHPHTLRTKSNLAKVLRKQGAPARARDLFEETLEANNRLFGPEHLDTLATKNGLAEVLRDQGDLLGARKMLEEVLEAQNRLFGPEHPRTLVTKSYLGEILRYQSDLPRARKIIEEVLEAQSRLLGPEHFDTLATQNGLAEVLRDQGDLPWAREIYQKVLEARIRVLGPEHPDTKKTNEALRNLH